MENHISYLLNKPEIASKMLLVNTQKCTSPFSNLTNIWNDVSDHISDCSAKPQYKDYTQKQFNHIRSRNMESLEKIRYFQGTIERVIKWNKICNDTICYYEVIGSCISIQEGTVRLQKSMLLRDYRGPILQVVYYTTTCIDIENFHIGLKLRCVGRMLGNNIMHAIRIKTASEDDINYLQRHCCVSDHSISNALRDFN